MMEILDGANGSRRLQIEFLRNGETGPPFVKLRAVRIEPGAIPPWETHETEPELYDPEDGAHARRVSAEHRGAAVATVRDTTSVRTEPVIVLPVQYFGRPAALRQPERRLMLAVLQDAVATYLKYRDADAHGERQAFREVNDWIHSDDIKWPFAFIRVCEWLGLDATYLRAGLAQIALSRSSESMPLPRPFRHMAGMRQTISA